ncbi:hypothetical protein EEG85_001770 [Neisseria gonorrhoeae]|uniref:hypothetical protein n=1 Tax=Neisseria meningitidis TaxID=487 RepID=UPI0013DF7E94|nr:hypothetical protein [Neisseria meningitidis]
MPSEGGVFRRIGRAPQVLSKSVCTGVYSGLNLNQYGVASPCRTICTVCGFVALS